MFAHGPPIVLAALLAFAAGCARALPPATHVVMEPARPSANEATINFFWSTGSCDPAGYYSIANDRSGLVARVARGSRASVMVQPGPHVFWAWNPVIERVMGGPSETDVALARIEAEPGRAYDVRLAFGEWDDGGPVNVFTQYGGRLSTISRRCVGSNVALVATRTPPDASGGSELPVVALDPGTSMDEHDLREHRALAEARFARLRPRGRALAVVEREGAEGTSQRK